ncbi:uncharacterized protein LOC107611045 [Arachis ipaensis]|uniref:uncharacterized protein LOC107611045 n=1 Tax=Arachis ipaensis TaxID=130454 RepID=UPI0007AEFB56|nr:uncharacterized protein LOC107611045 [Arachis ipaensis]XP_025670215.1 uncharacterized protein LOC112769994 [Arachis hypogaea]
MLMKVGKHPDDLVVTNIAVIDFSGASTPAKGLVTLSVKVRLSERNTVFVVVSSKASYNALLGQDWIHGVGVVPSTVHQSVLLWTKDGKPEVIKADSTLYVEQLHIDFRMYNPKLKPLTVDRTLNSYNCEGCYLSSEDMLIDSAAGNEILSFMDGYSGYNQIFIAEDDVSKTAFRCPGALGTYEWVVMPFGLKNAGATYQRVMNAIFHEYIGQFMEV